MNEVKEFATVVLFLLFVILARITLLPEVMSPLTAVLWVILIILLAVMLLTRKKTPATPNENAANEAGDGRALPGLKRIPNFGRPLEIGPDEKPLDVIEKLRKEHGEIYGFKVGSVNYCVINSMPLITELLTTNSDKFASKPDFFGFHSTFTEDRDYAITLSDWSVQQKIGSKIASPSIQPRISSLNSNLLNNIIKSVMQELVQTLMSLNGKASDPRILVFATANICFQYLCNKTYSLNDRNSRSVQDYGLIFREIFRRSLIDFMPWLKIFNQSQIQKIAELSKEFSNAISPIFLEHENNSYYKKDKKLVNIFLNHLAESQNKMNALTRKCAKIVIEDLISENSVLGNFWLYGLYLLADNPQVQKNVRAEIFEFAAGDSKFPNLEDMPNLTYLQGTIMEILRCSPSSVSILLAKQDTNIAEFIVPFNTVVIVHTHHLNMDPAFWKNPRTFEPERFLSESGRVLKPPYFLPFGTGTGTYMCDNLVKSILFMGFSTILQTFEISLTKDMPAPSLHEMHQISAPQNEIHLTFRRLTNRDLQCPYTTIDMQI